MNRKQRLPWLGEWGFDLFVGKNVLYWNGIAGAVLAGLDTDENDAIRNAGFSARDKTGLSQLNILMRAALRFNA
jgi:hypothetical protein